MPRFAHTLAGAGQWTDFGAGAQALSSVALLVHRDRRRVARGEDARSCCDGQRVYKLSAKAKAMTPADLDRAIEAPRGLALGN